MTPEHVKSTTNLGWEPRPVQIAPPCWEPAPSTFRRVQPVQPPVSLEAFVRGTAALLRDGERAVRPVARELNRLRTEIDLAFSPVAPRVGASAPNPEGRPPIKLRHYPLSVTRLTVVPGHVSAGNRLDRGVSVVVARSSRSRESLLVPVRRGVERDRVLGAFDSAAVRCSGVHPGSCRVGRRRRGRLPPRCGAASRSPRSTAARPTTPTTTGTRSRSRTGSPPSSAASTGRTPAVGSPRTPRPTSSTWSPA